MSQIFFHIFQIFTIIIQSADDCLLGEIMWRIAFPNICGNLRLGAFKCCQVSSADEMSWNAWAHNLMLTSSQNFRSPPFKLQSWRGRSSSYFVPSSLDIFQCDAPNMPFCQIFLFQVLTARCIKTNSAHEKIFSFHRCKISVGVSLWNVFRLNYWQGHLPVASLDPL